MEKKIERHDVKFFDSSVDRKDKMLDEEGRAIESYCYDGEYCQYTVAYNRVSKNYLTREWGELLMEEIAYRQGVRHGKYCRYEAACAEVVGIEHFPVLAEEGHYINGKKVGRWFYYNKDGDVKDIRMFVGGRDVTAEFANEKQKGAMAMYRLQSLGRGKGSEI